MPSTTSFEFGQIVLVRFPFTADKPIIKKILGKLKQRDQANLLKTIDSIVGIDT